MPLGFWRLSIGISSHDQHFLITKLRKWQAVDGIKAEGNSIVLLHGSQFLLHHPFVHRVRQLLHLLRLRDKLEDRKLSHEKDRRSQTKRSLTQLKFEPVKFKTCQVQDMSSSRHVKLNLVEVLQSFSSQAQLALRLRVPPSRKEIKVPHATPANSKLKKLKTTAGSNILSIILHWKISFMLFSFSTNLLLVCYTVTVRQYYWIVAPGLSAIVSSIHLANWILIQIHSKVHQESASFHLLISQQQVVMM